MSLVGLATLIALLSGAEDDAHARHREPAQIRAPGYSALQFEAPTAGEYTLPPLGAAADGTVIDETGRAMRLHDLYGDKITVLSFIYTSCPDVNGCPLAAFVLSQVQDRIMRNEQLAENTRLVSLSFDPRTDTPQVMQRYGNTFRADGFDWRFLTTESEDRLQPILDDYDQSVIRDYDADGKYLGSISHILRVYLIDRSGQIRNIYSPSFLHADILLADIETLLRDEP